MQKVVNTHLCGRRRPLIRQDYGAYGYANHKLVRSLIKSLRRKIGDDARAPNYIFNVRGVGYRMARSAD